MRLGLSVFKIVFILSFKGTLSLILRIGVTSTLGIILSSMLCWILSRRESSSGSRKGYGLLLGSSGLKRSSKDVRKRERRCGLGGSKFLALALTTIDAEDNAGGVKRTPGVV